MTFTPEERMFLRSVMMGQRPDGEQQYVPLYYRLTDGLEPERLTAEERAELLEQVDDSLKFAHAVVAQPREKFETFWDYFQTNIIMLTALRPKIAG